MSDYEIRRERMVEREVPVRDREIVVEREVPVRGSRVVVERGAGYGPGYGVNWVAPIIAAAVVILLLLLILGAFT